MVNIRQNIQGQEKKGLILNQKLTREPGDFELILTKVGYKSRKNLEKTRNLKKMKFKENYEI